MKENKEINPVEVKAVNSDTIYIKYSDGLEGEVKLAYLQKRAGFEILSDPEIFRKVKINEIDKDISWGDGLNICKNALHGQLELIVSMKKLGLDIE